MSKQKNQSTSEPVQVAPPKGTLSGGVFIPEPTPEDILAKDIRARFPGIGKENIARAGLNVFTASIKASVNERGFIQSEGPTPCAEQGATSLLDGNGRLTVLASLADEDPAKWGSVKVRVNIYPPLTDQQRTEILTRASRATAGFTQWDYWKQSMLTWKAFPNDSYVAHLRRMGLERAMMFFKPAPDSAIVRDKDGVRLKDGVKDDDLWGKNKGGQKQGPVQVGKELSIAHPRVVQAFFDASGADKEHSVSYTEVIECNKHWKADKEARPDLATPPAPFEVLVREFPDSQLVNGLLGQRLRAGKGTQGGREEGKGRMSAKETETLISASGLSQTRAAPILVRHMERQAGYVGESALRDVEAIFASVEAIVNANLDTPEGIATAKAAQKHYNDTCTRRFKEAAQEAQAHRDKLLIEEAAKKAKK